MTFDYKKPNYTEVIEERYRHLEKLKKDNGLLEATKIHYQSHPWDFINDWGWTYDPRNIERDLPANIPFVLWKRQIEYLQWVYNKWQAQERGLTEKSRDCGVTWLSIGFSVSMWCFVDGFSVGLGSRKQDLVDKRGDDRSLFEKARAFIDYTPKIFLPESFYPRVHSTKMMISNPETKASITGEVGNQIGRGGRNSIYFVDEAAFIEQQEVVDRALSCTTNCQIDISTPNGNGNLFYRKRMKFEKTKGKIFSFNWRDDPRKDEEWYKKQKAEHDEMTVGQEIDCDYNASQEDVFILAKWVAACIDAHIKLGFRASGIRVTGYDPADTGDAKAIVHRHGSIIKQAKQITDGDITQATPWAFDEADEFRADVLGYDGDGMGAPQMKTELKHMSANRMKVIAYHGSAGVSDPKLPIKRVKREHKQYKEGTSNLKENKGKTNADTYKNFRAQTWTWFRDRCELTYLAVLRADKNLLVNIDPEDLISIDSKCEKLIELQAELSRPKRIYTDNGMIKVESKKEMKDRNVESPNLADAAIIAMSIKKPPIDKKPLPKLEPWKQSVDGVM